MNDHKWMTIEDQERAFRYMILIFACFMIFAMMLVAAIAIRNERLSPDHLPQGETMVTLTCCHEDNLNLLNADFGEGWSFQHNLRDDQPEEPALCVYTREPDATNPAANAYVDDRTGTIEVEDAFGNRIDN